MSEAVTRGVCVKVECEYLPRHSNPDQRHWVFTYNVEIENRGDQPVQLISRHWIITNARGSVDEVKGPGVVGQQPRLAPGESFTYKSFCHLTTEMGTMHGTYQMVTDEGERFDATIAPFTLATPFAFN